MNSLGRHTKTILPSGAEVKKEYDMLGRILKTIYPDNSFVSFEHYPQSGSKMSHTRSFLPKKITNSEGHSTTFEYNELYALKKSTNPLGNLTTLGFDDLDRVNKITNPLGQEITKTYNQRFFATDVLIKFYPFYITQNKDLPLF